MNATAAELSTVKEDWLQVWPTRDYVYAAKGYTLHRAACVYAKRAKDPNRITGYSPADLYLGAAGMEKPCGHCCKDIADSIERESQR